MPGPYLFHRSALLYKSLWLEQKDAELHVETYISLQQMNLARSERSRASCGSKIDNAFYLFICTLLVTGFVLYVHPMMCITKQLVRPLTALANAFEDLEAKV